MEELDENQYLRYYAESIFAQYENKEFADIRVYRCFQEKSTYRDFINAATNKDYKLKSKEYIDLIYMMAMARDIRIDRNASKWLAKLIENDDFKGKLKEFISDIEAQRLKAISSALETDKSRLEYVNHNEPTGNEINWERYLRGDRVPAGLQNSNIATQTRIYSEARAAYSYIQKYVGFGHDYEIRERQEDIRNIKHYMIQQILDGNKKIKPTIVLPAEDKEKLPILKLLLRSVGRTFEIEETEDKITLKTNSVLEKEMEMSDLEIE